MTTIRLGSALVGVVSRLLLAATVLLAAPAQGQTPPDGNAPAKTRVVSEAEGGAELTNPFGQPAWPTTVTTETKRALAAGVDLDPLRSLAVFHNGRVKVLDSLARETVGRIAGRKTYFDLVTTADGKAAKAHYEPMFTLLDLMIDPAYYASKPLVAVDYLPLRQEILTKAFPTDERERERWLKLTRISPQMVAQYSAQVEQEHAFDMQYRTGLGKLAQAFELYERSPANLLMVAPESREQPWTHLSALPAGSPIRQAAARLGEAWRAGDAPGVNAAVRTLAAELPTIHPGVYPTTKRTLEMAYNRSNAFEWGFWAYGVALVSLLVAFGTGRPGLKGLGVGLLALAVGLHAFGFVTRCIIAERFAIQNQFESMTGLSLFGALVGLTIMVLKRQPLFGAAAAGLGFLVLITATQTGIPGLQIEREAAILNTSVLLKYHVTTVLCSYGLITLGFITSLFYLGTHYATKWKRKRPDGWALAGVDRGGGGESEAVAAQALGLGDKAPAGPARTLADLDTAQMTVLQLAFWTLGVGILLGAWWADHSWGRWWAFDPKETWALATWIIYLIVIHLRFTTSKNRALVTAWMSVLGFVVMLWTYFGVNLLLPGLHAYA
jgi:cytochrome c-type biogenesis protein CcsB